MPFVRSKRESVAVLLVGLFLASSPGVLPGADASHVPPKPTCLGQVDIDIAIVMDTSGSMNDGGKMAAAQTAAAALLANLGPQDQSALVTFDTGVALPRNLTFDHTGPFPSTESYVNLETAGGLTAIWKGVRMARYELINQPYVPPGPYSGDSRIGIPGTKQAMVVLSDGDQTVGGGDPVVEAALAKGDGIEIFTVALGTALSQSGTDTLKAVASTLDHYFESPDPQDLPAIFQRISYLLRDVADPTVDLVRPIAPPRLYYNDAAIGPSPVALPAVKNAIRPHAVADDDCLVEEVAIEVDEYQGTTFLGTMSLGAVHATANLLQDDGTLRPVYAADVYQCGDAVGPHRIRVTVTDWLGRTVTDTGLFVCIREYVTADATALYTRLTNPDDPTVEAAGIHLNGGTGPQERWLHNVSSAAPAYNIATGYDQARGHDDPDADRFRAATARSRLENVFVDPLSIEVTLLETRACASLNTDPARPEFGPPFRGTTCYRHDTYRIDEDPVGMGVAAKLDATVRTLLALAGQPGCETGQLTPGDPGSPTVTHCWEARVFVPDPASASAGGGRGCRFCPQSSGIEILLGERFQVDGATTWEVTVNGLHVIAERPQARWELILAQSYAGASLLGPDALVGPWRSLDRERDAGLPGDAPDTLATPMVLAKGAYGARLARADDVDVYATTVSLGEKVHVAVVPSNQQSATLFTLPSATTATTPLTAVRIELYDPNLVLRDAKESLLPGVPTQVELNVDVPGTWTFAVRLPARGGPTTDYTLTVAVTPAPATRDNDALTLQDAGETCLDGLFVGPGVHLGAIEDKDADPSDWYRFRLFEGQIAILALRPGDTLDSTDLRLRFFDPHCNEIGGVSTLLLPGGFKGSPDSIVYSVPVGGDGIYRAAVEYVNGLGTYELVLGTSEAAILGGVP